MKKLFTGNRKRFAKEMKNNSLLVIFAGLPPAKRGDELYPFVPQRNFYYLTGIDKPALIFVMHKNGSGKITETLCLERFDETKAKWDGEVLNAEDAEKVSGIEDFAFVDEFYEYTADMLMRRNVKSVYVDMENRSFSKPVSPDLEFAALLRERFPGVSVENAYPIFADLRAIKSKEEIRFIKKAVDITGEAFLLMLENAKAGMMEYELEAYIDFVFKKSGCRDAAFKTVLASGKNAAVLHYSENNSKITDGDLILADFGAQVGWYSADITRTFPASGKFTDRQKEIYNIVLEGNRRIISMIKPGAMFKDLNEALVNYYYKALKKIGFANSRDDVSKYYFHGVSHMLGLETHDIGRGSETVLKAGMVLTVEPGLYLEEEGIGIRIEDDVLVTDGGCLVLSDGIIKTVEEIEAFMA